MKSLKWGLLFNKSQEDLMIVAGLTLSFTLALFLITQLFHQLSYEKWLVEHDKVFRVHTHYSLPDQAEFLTVRSAGNLAPAILLTNPELVAASTRLFHWDVTLTGQFARKKTKMLLADASFPKVFTLPLVQGDIKTALQQPNSILISSELADKLFASQNVIGRNISACCFKGEERLLTVTGVLADDIETHLDLTSIVSLDPTDFENDNGLLDSWLNVNMYSYIKLHNAGDAQKLQDQINSWLTQDNPIADNLNSVLKPATPFRANQLIGLNLMPIVDIYLHAKAAAGHLGDQKALGSIFQFYLILFSAIVVVLIGSINSMVFTMTKLAKVAQHIATARCHGMSSQQVFASLYVRCAMHIMIALLLAIPLVLISTKLLALPHNIWVIQNWLYILLALSIFVAVWAAALSAYPCHFILKSRIADATKSVSAGAKNRLIAGFSYFSLFQIALAFSLLFSASVIYFQYEHLQTRELGYDANNVVIFDLQPLANQSAFVEELRESLSGIEHTRVSEPPTMDNENSKLYQLLDTPTILAKSEQQVVNYISVEPNFFQFFRIKFLQAQHAKDNINFSEEDVVLTNTALKLFGIVNAEQAMGLRFKVFAFDSGESFVHSRAVVTDLALQSAYEMSKPVIFDFDNQRWHYLLARVDNEEQLRSLNMHYQKHLGHVEETSLLLKTLLTQLYSEEWVTFQLTASFGLLSFGMVVIGMLAIQSYIMLIRQSEFLLRTINGATELQLLQDLFYELTSLILKAFLAAGPVMAVFCYVWLDRYAMPVAWSVIVKSCGLTFVMTYSVLTLSSLLWAKSILINRKKTNT
ncbi:ABC transporter permease [Alteromonas sp. CYL-A6]|uniref:ABC transporter permease n=1 Tax=Alteromonas nitratireducens TaxID=3390813 RepID=UPI0034C3528D